MGLRLAITFLCNYHLHHYYDILECLCIVYNKVLVWGCVQKSSCVVYLVLDLDYEWSEELGVPDAHGDVWSPGLVDVDILGTVSSRTWMFLTGVCTG